MFYVNFGKKSANSFLFLLVFILTSIVLYKSVLQAQKSLLEEECRFVEENRINYQWQDRYLCKGDIVTSGYGFYYQYKGEKKQEWKINDGEFFVNGKLKSMEVTHVSNFKNLPLAVNSIVLNSILTLNIVEKLREVLPNCDIIYSP